METSNVFVDKENPTKIWKIAINIVLSCEAPIINSYNTPEFTYLIFIYAH